MAIITVSFIASPRPARQPCFHSIKAGCFQAAEEMSMICLSGMDPLNSGALVNANWTFGPCSFSRSAFHSILALKAVNTVIHVRTSPIFFNTDWRAYTGIILWAGRREDWGRNFFALEAPRELLMVMALNGCRVRLYMSMCGPATLEEDNSCNNSGRISDQTDRRTIQLQMQGTTGSPW